MKTKGPKQSSQNQLMLSFDRTGTNTIQLMTFNEVDTRIH